MWALGIAAVLGIGWLLLRPKKAEAKPAPAPTPAPTTTPDGTPFGGKPDEPKPPQQKTPKNPMLCTLTPDQFQAWGEKAQRFGPWLTQAGQPPPAATLKQQYPDFANTPTIRLAALTSGGAVLWLYGAFEGVPPVQRDDVHKNICDWVKDPTTPLIGT